MTYAALIAAKRLELTRARMRRLLADALRPTVPMPRALKRDPSHVLLGVL